MHTTKLRQIQQPSMVKGLLEACVLRTETLPDGSHHVTNPYELPLCVRDVVTRAARAGQVWLCWARSSQIWLFTGEMSLPLSRERGAPVLQVRCYGENAELRDSRTWKYDPAGTWSRCVD